MFQALILYKNNIQQEGGQAYDEQTIALILYKNNIQLMDKRDFILNNWIALILYKNNIQQAVKKVFHTKKCKSVNPL